MKSIAGIFHKRNYRINGFLSSFAVFWAINCWMLNAGYCGTQSLEFRPFFLWQIPFNQIRPFGENGNYVSKSFFPSFKSTGNQSCAPDLITPARQKSQELALSVSYPADALTVNVETVSGQNSQNASKGGNYDGFQSWHDRLIYLGGHFLSAFWGAMVALWIYRRIQIRKQS